MKLPLWVRAMQLGDRLSWYAFRFEEVTREEIFRAWLRPELRAAVTEHAYARQASYLPGGATYERGLFDWEEEALSKPPFPAQGRVLLGAAGGGRELAVLCARGFEVVAFEPNVMLRAGANAVARQYPNAHVYPGTYGDFVAAAKHGAGLLAPALEGGGFDAVILGWGSFTHVLTREEQAAVLRAARRAAPTAPVLVSFFLRPEGGGPNGRSERLRARLRSIFSALGGHTPPEGVAYEMDGGFVYLFTEEEIHDLAFKAGYEVTSLKASPFPHAVLVPLEGALQAS